MKEVLKATLLESEKSSFLIDLVKHENGKLYIEILQTILDENDTQKKSVIKINPSVIDELIDALTEHAKLLSLPSDKLKTELLKKVKKIDKLAQEEVIKRYLKGISIKDLALQFDCEEYLINEILTKHKIPIVTNEMPEYLIPSKRKKFRRR